MAATPMIPTPNIRIKGDRGTRIKMTIPTPDICIKGDRGTRIKMGVMNDVNSDDSSCEQG